MLIRLGGCGAGAATGLPDNLDVCIHAGVYRVLRLRVWLVHVRVGGVGCRTSVRSVYCEGLGLGVRGLGFRFRALGIRV